ncbi:hypothetical protein CsSME_00021291 [Camellia sinensis var. sinensis]
MENTVSGRLVGWETHGFPTMEDLDVGSIMEDAKTRWLRPNEIHAILCNPKYFSVNVKPVNLPKSGTIVLFDRKMLRNFRKDGYNWKKKKDGKTVKEAHEHLKVGNEEKIHVYYAHGEDNSTFVRRCYWLLDKTLEHIVLVHYRETQEPGGSMTHKNHEMTLHEINTLEWEELLVLDDPSKLSAPDGVGTGETLDIIGKDGLQTQDSFGRWINYIMADSPGSVDDLEFSIQSSHESSTSPMMDHLQSSVPVQIFTITDVSPGWAFSTEETKILITGFFNDPHLAKSDIYCVCGDACGPAEIVQSGVFRCLVSPHTPGSVNLYLSFDGHNPISQVLTFEYRAPLTGNWMISAEEMSNWEKFRVQMRLAHLLFSTSKSLNFLSSKVSPDTLKEAKKFAHKTSHIADGWAYMIESIENNKISFQQAKDSLFELALKNRLYEWLLERVVEGCITSDRDEQGQGVIHLCSILDYTWAVYPFACSGLSLDYRDKFGWTALHWAAYCGREKMVAALLSAGAKPNLVTDPNSENPGGCTAADLASIEGYDGLAAYLAEKGLVEHFKEMTIAGNVSGSLQTSTPDSVNLRNLSKEELYLKDTLAAYRTAADAAARIQAAFREHSFKLRAKAIEFSNPENEARSIIAAMKIQHAFRNYESRKTMAAAARIQHRFRTWKTRREFLNMRCQVIKIQAVFRGFQVRKQYRKITWSVGVLEKAILRWRMKRRGFRGFQVLPAEAANDPMQESDVEEDFFRASRKQAEQRVERSVVRVQAMFRSKKAQQEYQMMKLAHNQARLEYEGLVSPDIDMG